MTRKLYSSVQLLEGVREEIQGVQLEFSARARRRLTMSEIVSAALVVARKHGDEYADILRKDDNA